MYGWPFRRALFSNPLMTLVASRRVSGSVKEYSTMCSILEVPMALRTGCESVPSQVVDERLETFCLDEF